MEPWRTIDAHNGGKWSPGGSVDQWSQMLFTLIMSRMRIHIIVNIRIQSIELKWKDRFWSALKWCGSETLPTAAGVSSFLQYRRPYDIVPVHRLSSCTCSLKTSKRFLLTNVFFLPQSFHYSSRAERRSTLKEIFGFTCGCDECSQPDHVVAGMDLTYSQSSGSADFSRVRVRYYL